jgi:hypothetical protein
MTRAARPRTASTIEVTLTDLTDDRPRGDAPVGGTGDRPQPNWRRIVGIASIAGAVTGVVVGIVIANSDGAEDEDDVEPAATAAVADEASEITTPPTLPSLDALPRPDFTSRNTASTAPSATVIDDTLDAAMAELGADISRRSTTRLEVGAEGPVLHTRITYDAPNRRYEVVMLSNGFIDRLIVDIDGGWTYVDESLSTWTRYPNEDVARSIGEADMRTFVDRYMFGPIRPDTVDGALVIDTDVFVDLGGGPIAREHAVTVLAERVPEWVDYRLGQIGDAPTIAPDEEISYLVYVTGEGKLRRVVGEWPHGETTQRVEHDLTRLTIPVTVELPPPSSVRDPDESSDASPIE